MAALRADGKDRVGLEAVLNQFSRGALPSRSPSGEGERKKEREARVRRISSFKRMLVGALQAAKPGLIIVERPPEYPYAARSGTSRWRRRGGRKAWTMTHATEGGRTVRIAAGHEL